MRPKILVERGSLRIMWYVRLHWFALAGAGLILRQPDWLPCDPITAIKSQGPC